MMDWDEQFKELTELTENNKKLIKQKFKQFDEMLDKAKKSLERTEYLIKHFGERL